jgi:hypothetical protein
MKKGTFITLGIIFGFVLIGISITVLVSTGRRNVSNQEKLEGGFEKKTPISAISQTEITPAEKIVEIKNSNEIYKAVYSGETVLIDTRHDGEYITYEQQPNYSISDFEKDKVSDRELILTSEQEINVYDFLEYKDRMYLSLFSSNEYFLYEINLSTNENKLLYVLNSENKQHLIQATR